MERETVDLKSTNTSIQATPTPPTVTLWPTPCSQLPSGPASAAWTTGRTWGAKSSGGAAGVCGLPWLLQRPAPRQPQTPPLSRSDLQVDGMGHPHDSGDRVRQSHLAQVVLQPRNGARNGPRRGRTAAAAAQPAPTLVLCTLTVAVWLLAARAISIRHKAPAAALRVPATPRACSKRSAACNTLAKRKPAEKHQPDGAVPASTRAQVSGSPRRWISRSD